MYNLRARYYDPNTGRFNAMDSFRGGESDPQSLHKYLYAHCDPVNGIDPSGNYTLTELELVGLITGLLLVGVLQSFVGVYNQSHRAVGRSMLHQQAVSVATATTITRTKSREEVKKKIKKETDDDPDQIVFLHGTSTLSWPEYALGKIDPLMGTGGLGIGFYTVTLADLDAAIGYAWQAEHTGGTGDIGIILFYTMSYSDFAKLNVKPGTPYATPAFLGCDVVVGPLGAPYGGIQYKWEVSGVEKLFPGFKGFVPIPKIEDIRKWTGQS